MDNIEKLVELHKSLMTLCHGDGYIERSRHDKLCRLIYSCAQQLEVARVSVWALNNAHSMIHCEVLYLREDNDYQSGIKLTEADFPAYFVAIKQDRLINADDARNDPRTYEFTESYLKPQAIFSMLDLPIFAAGKLSGVLCIEQTDTLRNWNVVEMSYAAAVADAISTINEQELWLRARKQSEFHEQCDSLTGLKNRLFFQRQIDYDLQEEPNVRRALVALGLDAFTAVNDKFGNSQANQVLKTLAERFQQNTASLNSFLSRLGGDVFGFWLSDIYSSRQVDELLDAIQQALMHPVITLEGNEIKVSGSMGVFSYPYIGDGIPDPVRGAEIAMKNAKQQKTGATVYFSVQWYQLLMEHEQQANELRNAFDQQQLRAFYQPIIGQGINSKIGLEALVRWEHPQNGIMTPEQFLPLVSELGFMKFLGDFMLRTACQDFQILRKSGYKLDWVSVNLSAQQLYSLSLVADIQGILREYDLPGSCLELEIVEELIGQDSELVLAQLRGLSELGIGLSIDDFGTGYSSLSRLKHLPVNKLKIDKLFVDGLPESFDDQCITRSIIGLAKAMHLELVAEGVETTEQADWLCNEAIEFLQGYLFAKPMRLLEVQNFLAELH